MVSFCGSGPNRCARVCGKVGVQIVEADEQAKSLSFAQVCTETGRLLWMKPHPFEPATAVTISSPQGFCAVLQISSDYISVDLSTPKKSVQSKTKLWHIIFPIVRFRSAVAKSPAKHLSCPQV